MRRLAALTLVLFAAGAGPASAAPVTSLTQAPFTVRIVSRVGECTGTLIDASHVLTAAGCVLDAQGNPLPPSAFGILAGTIVQGLLGPDAQNAAIDQVRVHPAYRGTGAAPVALLRLSAPLTLTAAVAPAAVVQEEDYPRGGSLVTGYAWGRTAGNDPFARSEQTWDTQVRLSFLCIVGRAGYGCGRSAPACDTNVGGPVVQAGDPPHVVGVVVDYRARACGDTEDDTLFVDLATPAIAQWVFGDESPDPMPHTSQRPVLRPPPRRGGAIGCTPPLWSQATTTVTDFVQFDNGRAVQQVGHRTYIPRASDVGHVIGCRSEASSAGGNAATEASTTVSIVSRRAGRWRICVDRGQGARTCRWWRPA